MIEEEKRAERERKTEENRIQDKIEFCLKTVEIYEKFRQDIKTLPKRLFVRIF